MSKALQPTCPIQLAVERFLTSCRYQNSSAETIPTLKNRESIHFAKFGHDTRADTLFWRIDSFYESILGKIQHIYEHKGCQICIMEVEKGFYSSSKQPSLF